MRANSLRGSPGAGAPCSGAGAGDGSEGAGAGAGAAAGRPVAAAAGVGSGAESSGSKSGRSSPSGVNILRSTTRMGFPSPSLMFAAILARFAARTPLPARYDSRVSEELGRLVALVERLRRECPWDREQTLGTLRTYLLE